MAIQLLKFREFPNGTFGLVVWLDDTQATADGSPDPAYLRRYTYPAVPAGLTKANYLASVKRETKLLVQDELAKLAVDQGAALAGEGQVL